MPFTLKTNQDIHTNPSFESYDHKSILQARLKPKNYDMTYGTPEIKSDLNDLSSRNVNLTNKSIGNQDKNRVQS